MTLRVISLGVGVQSTTLALMAERGEIGPTHCGGYQADGPIHRQAEASRTIRTSSMIEKPETQGQGCLPWQHWAYHAGVVVSWWIVDTRARLRWRYKIIQ